MYHSDFKSDKPLHFYIQSTVKNKPFEGATWLFENQPLGVLIPDGTSCKTAIYCFQLELYDAPFEFQTRQTVAFLRSKYPESWALSGGKNDCFGTRRLVCTQQVEDVANYHLQAPGDSFTMHHSDYKPDKLIYLYPQNTLKNGSYSRSIS